MKDNEVSKNNNILPGWMDEFANLFRTKVAEDESQQPADEKTTVAEINIKDLPKVTWNDETFYINLDSENSTAMIINGFGNVVTTLDQVETLDDVNKALNDKQIVSEKNNDFEIDASMQEEINKALNYVNDCKNEDEKLTDEKSDKITSNENIKAEKEQNINELKAIISEVIDNKFKDITSALNKKIAELNSIQEQFYARDMNTPSEYDEARDEDVRRAEEAEEITKQKIDKDNSIDRTTPEGKYSTNNLLENENIDTFKKGICPCCGSQLMKSDMDGEYVNIQCSNKECNKKYAVNLNNENIYHIG